MAGASVVFLVDGYYGNTFLNIVEAEAYMVQSSTYTDGPGTKPYFWVVVPRVSLKIG